MAMQQRQTQSNIGKLILTQQTGDIGSDILAQTALFIGKQAIKEQLTSKKLLQRLEDYNAIASNGALPENADTLLQTLPAHHLSASSLLEKQNDPAGNSDYRYKMFGAEAAELLGADMTGKSIRDYPGHNRSTRNFIVMSKLLEHRTPLAVIGEVSRLDGSPVALEALILPFEVNGIIQQVFVETDKADAA